MNTKAAKFHRSNIPSYPESVSTTTDELIVNIINSTSQTAINKTDEVDVMRCMLNDPDFRVAIYDKHKGYIGSRCPREEALGLSIDTLSGATGISTKEAKAIVSDYQFSKKDARRFINISKDFYSTYLQTGRKTVLISEPRGETTIQMRYSEPKAKTIPDPDEYGKTKNVITQEMIKIKADTKRY